MQKKEDGDDDTDIEKKVSKVILHKELIKKMDCDNDGHELNILLSNDGTNNANIVH